MTRRKPARANPGMEDPACARAWDRLEVAETRLLRAGGAGMEQAVDGFYDAWMGRMAAILDGGAAGTEGAEGDATLPALESSIVELEQLAVTPEAHEAMSAFLEVAILEVEAAVIRSTGAPPPRGRKRARWDSMSDRRWGRC